MAIYDWILEEIETELDKLTATIIRLEKSAVTVYDPAHGEIQMELHLPIAIKSLDSVPVVNLVPYMFHTATFPTCHLYLFPAVTSEHGFHHSQVQT